MRRVAAASGRPDLTKEPAMKRSMIVLLAAMVGVSPLRAQEVSPIVEAAALRAVAAAIPPGTRVRVQTTDGRRYTATLLSADADGVLLKRSTRIPEPAQRVSLDHIAMLERDPSKGGIGLGKAIGLGLAAGAGAVLSLIAFIVIVSD
jgi:hypothetical protein